MPIIRRTNSLQPIDLSNKKIIYSKDYTRSVPDYQSQNTSFKNSTVRYTKFRKEFTHDYSHETRID